MRVAAPRPRHTSQGEDKDKPAAGNVDGEQDTTGDHVNNGKSTETDTDKTKSDGNAENGDTNE
jgi:hypothetical protein